MKPKNFPERKRQRQLRVLESLQYQLPQPTAREQHRVLELINTLEDRTHVNLSNKNAKKRRGIGVKTN